ncbi:MAG: VanZ family protein [Pseudomonadota bacterium]
MRALVLALGLLVSLPVWAAPVTDDFPWNEWGDDVFQRAQREDKFVLLSLQAWWCHPCHQMNTITYTDPTVRELIDSKFIPVYVDQDSRPDISQRYERWGWPATVLFGADGTEIVKLRGFYSPQFFLPILQATIDDPSPVNYGRVGGDERKASKTTHLTAAQRKVIVDFMNEVYDHENGGWGQRVKFVDGPTLVYALEQGADGTPLAAQARETVMRLTAMVNSEHGGVSQISLETDWSAPLQEYPMFAQEAALVAFSLAYARWGDKPFLDAANRVANFLSNTLSDADGGFYTSFGAERFNPGIDRRIYARETGQAAAALVTYFDATGNLSALARAERAARWALAQRKIEGGGFRHDKNDAGGPYLVDTLAMARAMLRLYRSTGDQSWLRHTVAAAEFIQSNFVDANTGGFISSVQPALGFMNQTVKQKDENVRATRLFNALWYYTGRSDFRDIAEQGMGYLTSPPVLDGFYFLPGVLQAEYELAHEPVHITVVGARKDAAAQALYKAALAYPTLYKRAEWWDKSEGALPRDDVTYPELDTAAAFACSESICSTPIRDPSQIGALSVTIIYACFDEFHQLYIPGRTGRVSDILIDSMGSIIALGWLNWNNHFGDTRRTVGSSEKGSS